MVIDEGNIEEILSHLEKSDVFSDLPADIRVDVAKECQLVKLDTKELLFSQGDASDSVYLLVEGQLISFLHTPEGMPLTVGSIHIYELVGELGTLSGSERSLSVEALLPAKLIRIPAELFIKLWESYPKIMSYVSKKIIHRSLKNIHLMSSKNESYNTILIIPIIENFSFSMIGYQLRRALSFYPHTFITTNDMTYEQITQKINQPVHAGEKVIIYMHEWNSDIFKYCFDKSVKIYIMLYEGEKLPLEYFQTHIYSHIKNHPHLRLELILLHPEHIKVIANTKKYLRLAPFQLHHHLRINQEEDYNRIARFMLSKARVLVLGGGGARGLSHLGVVGALLDKQIPIDAIGGTSGGSIIGACYAFTLNYTSMVHYTQHLKEAAIKSISFSKVTWPIASIFSAGPFTEKLIYLFANACIEDMLIPYFAVSANLSTNNECAHTEGLLWQAIRASVSLPGMLPPVEVDGQLLFDGGLVNNLPVDTMRHLVGPDSLIIASSLSGSEVTKEKYRFPSVLTLKQTLLYRMGLGYKNYSIPPFFDTFRSAILMGSSTKELANATLADILIKPKISNFKLLSTIKSQENTLINLGYEATVSALQKYFKNRKDKS